MKRLRGISRLLIIFLILLCPHHAYASDSDSHVIITEVQTASLQSADHEFVEVYNPTDNIIPLENWKLQYLSSTGTNWTTKLTLNGYLMPKSTLLLASTGYLVEAADFSFNAGFKVEAGHLRIISVDKEGVTTIQDLIGWGITAKNAEALPAIYSLAGQSMMRNSVNNKYVDTDNNQTDFFINQTPSPESTNIIPANITDLIPQEDVLNEQSPQTLSEETQEEPKKRIDQSHLAAITITELLPNPAPPDTDANDEYIELYNPNSEPFYLEGYQLQTGNNYRYKYVFGEVVISGYQYLVLYSSETELALSNTSGRARLVDPDGITIYETEPYEKAKDGVAWSLIDGKWQWSAKPTAGESNILIAPSSIVKKKKATKQKAKKPNKTTKSQLEQGQVAGAISPNNSKMNKWVIAVMGVLAIGYALYEYKDDIKNNLIKFRRNRTIRRDSRETIQGG